MFNTCPSCGYCPTCGKKNTPQFAPYQPYTIPFMPSYPNWNWSGDIPMSGTPFNGTIRGNGTYNFGNNAESKNS